MLVEIPELPFWQKIMEETNPPCVQLEKKNYINSCLDIF